MGKGEDSNGSEDGDSTSSGNKYNSSSTTEASKMLEAALLQMDGIISGTCADTTDVSHSLCDWKESVKETTRALISAIQNAPFLPPPPDQNTVEFLLQWLKPVRLFNIHLNY